MAIEIFKTNVNDRNLADILIGEIHKAFAGHKANFDLEDCDCILRIQCDNELIQTMFIIRLLKDFGCNAEVLND